MLHSFESSTPSENEGAAVAWIAAQLERNQKAPAAKSAAAQVPFWRAMFRIPYMAAAAALIVAAALGISLYHSENRQPILQPPQVGVYRSGEIQLQTKGDVSEAPDQLIWAAVPGAASYSVEVDDVTGDKIWQSNTSQSSIRVAPDLKARMVPGKPLKWTVTALDPNGKELAAGKANFRVAVK